MLLYLGLFVCILLTAAILYYVSVEESYINYTSSDSDAYVINLKERNDRWEQIQKEFRNSKIILKKVEAVKHTRGQTGIALSTLKIIRLAKEQGLKAVLIFEDDNKPEINSDKNWFIMKKWLDSHMDEWEIFNGGLFGLSNIERRVDLENNVTLIKTKGGYMANWLYVNESAYDKILEWEQVGKPLNDLWFSNSFNFWCGYPLLGTQHQGFSDIDKRVKNLPEEYTREIEKYKRLLNT